VGCGDSDQPAATPRPEATPPRAATPARTASPTPTAFAPSAPAPPRDIPEERDRDDERRRVNLTVDGEGITPPQVAVPSRIPLEFVIRNDLPRPVRVRLGRRSITVPARSRRALRLAGLRPGQHVLDAGAAGRAEVVAAPPGTP
jgi:hypothetical protein